MTNDPVEVALTEARDTFNHYAELHRAKGTAEADDKADANAMKADKMQEALDVLRSRRTVARTGPRVASIAARIMGMGPNNLLGLTIKGREDLIRDIHAVAASALRQDETAEPAAPRAPRGIVARMLAKLGAGND